MAPRLIVLGWDSATFDVGDPLMDAGALPALASMCRDGFRSPLRSTWPPMTDCAWTSAFTGRNPGAHGIFGSWYRAPGAYACRYFSARDRRAPALWEMAPDIRFLVWNVPMAYPPEAIDGVMVAGYGAPPGSAFCEPPSVQDDLARRWDLRDLADRAPHGSLEGLLTDLERGLASQAEAVIHLIGKHGIDCALAVWPHIDRAQHFFWRFRETDHLLRDAVDRVYQAADGATAAIIEAFPDSDVVIVSDHGAGPLKGDVNLGAWLAERGHARYGGAPKSSLAHVSYSLAPSVRRLAKRLAPKLARRAVGAEVSAQLGPFDWSGTRAFLGIHSDLWLNVEGREPDGTVPPDEADDLAVDLAESILSIEDPRNGDPVFAAAYRRQEIYAGPASDLAPDVMLDPWSNGYRITPARGPSEEIVSIPSALLGVKVAWSCDHRPHGMLAAWGPRIATGTKDELHLYDVCPTALALLERPVPVGLDGRVAEETIDRDWLSKHPVVSASAHSERRAEGGYSEEEAAAVARHLEDLGYIE